MSDTSTEAAPLTVVLVHGAFADSSSWNGVVERLQAAGVQGHRTRRTRCAASHTTPPTSSPSSSRYPGRSSPSATPTAAR